MDKIKGFFDDRKEKDINEAEVAISSATIEEDLSNKEIIMLAIATSIDALAVGVSFAFLRIPIIPVVRAAFALPLLAYLCSSCTIAIIKPLS